MISGGMNLKILEIFSDFKILTLIRDWQYLGVFLKGQKPLGYDKNTRLLDKHIYLFSDNLEENKQNFSPNTDSYSQENDFGLSAIKVIPKGNFFLL